MARSLFPFADEEPDAQLIFPWVQSSWAGEPHSSSSLCDFKNVKIKATKFSHWADPITQPSLEPCNRLDVVYWKGLVNRPGPNISANGWQCGIRCQCLLERVIPALLSSASQKQLRFREGDSENQIQEVTQHDSRDYTEVTESTGPNLGAHWLGLESFAFYTGLEAPPEAQLVFSCS